MEGINSSMIQRRTQLILGHKYITVTSETVWLQNRYSIVSSTVQVDPSIEYLNIEAFLFLFKHLYLLKSKITY